MKRLSLFVCLLGIALLPTGCQTCCENGQASRALTGPAAVATVDADPGWTVVRPGDNL